jgi:hypothetical protein
VRPGWLLFSLIRVYRRFAMQRRPKNQQGLEICVARKPPYPLPPSKLTDVWSK